ncbi:MAG: hypothetical protein R6X06_06570 [Gammaproteobacteria bacterium]
MYLLVRFTLLVFLGIAITSYFFGSKFHQQALEAQQQDAAIAAAREHCAQLLAEETCRAPYSRRERQDCSRQLAESRCQDYVDVGQRILEHDRAPQGQE